MSFTSWLRNLRSALAPGQMARKHRRRRPLRAATHRPCLVLSVGRRFPTHGVFTIAGPVLQQKFNPSGGFPADRFRRGGRAVTIDVS